MFLPEASDYIGSSADESLALARSSDQAEFVSALQKAAQLERIHINVGIHEVASEQRLKNSLIWIDDKGAITQNYHKIHLFDVDIKGGPVLKESAWVSYLIPNYLKCSKLTGTLEPQECTTGN